MNPFPSKFCIVDDDREFVEFLVDYLRARGAEALGWQSAEAFIEADRVTEFDFFIFDLNLGRIDGVDLIALIRAQTNKGILVVSGRMGPDAFNSALAAGADMFVNKPVRFDQIYHAVASVARRTGAELVHRERPWVLDPDEGRLVSPEGNEVALSPVETRILATLHSAGTTPVQRARFLESSLDTAGAHRNLDAAIFRLRRKVEAETGARPPFRTVHAFGYQLLELMALKKSLKSER